MKKIRLDLDALKVESLVTSEGGSETDGTVFAMAMTNCDPTCNVYNNTCGPDEPCNWPDQTQAEWTMGGQSCTGGGITQAVGCFETNHCTDEGETCDSPGGGPCFKTERVGGW